MLASYNICMFLQCSLKSLSKYLFVVILPESKLLVSPADILSTGKPGDEKLKWH